MNLKSQITLFIVIGLVLLVAFGFVFHLSNVMAKTNAQKNTDKLVTEIITTSAIEYYVTLALDKVAKEATLTLAKQGGVIYCNQKPGYTYPFACIPRSNDNSVSSANFYSDNSYYIVYGITAPATSQERYPEAEGASGPVYIENQNFDLGNFGLSPLCSRTGPNRVKETWEQSTYPRPCDRVILAPAYNSVGADLSMQKQLGDYVSFLVTQEVTTDSFEKYGYSIELGNVRTNVTFGDDNTDFELIYPLTFLFQGREPIIKRLYFRTSLPVDLKSMGTVALNLMGREATRPYFKLSEFTGLEATQKTGYGWREGIGANFEQKQDPPDLLRITDAYSYVDATPCEFDYAIENRPPALNWIHDEQLQVTDIDIAVRQGEGITIPPNDNLFAVDPDEDLFTASFSGWKWDSKDTFDFSCCLNQGDLVPGGCLDLDMLKGCITYNIPSAKEWIGPEAGTNRVTLSATNLEDVGLHTLNIRVTDEHGLYDAQEVHIFVAQCVIGGTECNVYNTQLYCDQNNKRNINRAVYGCTEIVSTAAGVKYGLCTDDVLPDIVETTCGAEMVCDSSTGTAICQLKCYDGDDSDSNGLTDCMDPACAFSPNCLIQ